MSQSFDLFGKNEKTRLERERRGRVTGKSVVKELDSKGGGDDVGGVAIEEDTNDGGNEENEGEEEGKSCGKEGFGDFKKSGGPRGLVEGRFSFFMIWDDGVGVNYPFHFAQGHFLGRGNSLGEI